MPPAVALLDTEGADGRAAVRALRRRAPRMRIVVLAIPGTVRDVIAWAEAGIAG